MERAEARQSLEAWGGPCQLGWGGADTGIAREDSALARVGQLALTAQPLDSRTGESQSCSPGVLWLALCHPGPVGLSQEETKRA